VQQGDDTARPARKPSIKDTSSSALPSTALHLVRLNTVIASLPDRLYRSAAIFSITDRLS